MVRPAVATAAANARTELGFPAALADPAGAACECRGSQLAS
jgi:hypothetical protein